MNSDKQTQRKNSQKGVSNNPWKRNIGKDNSTKPAPAQNPRLWAFHDLLTWLKTERLEYRTRGTGLSERDYALYRQILHTTIRFYRKYTRVLELLTKKKVNRLDLEVVACLCIGLAQLEKDSRMKEHAVLHETVGLMSKIGKPFLKGFINANLREYLRERESIQKVLEGESPAVITSHPTWMFKKWEKQFGFEKASDIAFANNLLPQISISLAYTEGEREKTLSQLEALDFRLSPLPFLSHGFCVENPDDLFLTETAKSGAFLVQDYSSQVLIQLLDGLQKKRTLDACAAPGGKLYHLERRYQGEIEELVGCDASEHRMKRLVSNGELFKSQANLMVVDALEFSSDQQFDLIITDVPCSATGTIRKHPEIKWRRTPEDLQRNQMKQLQILESLQNYLLVGGHLLYVTCSLEEEENQQVVTQFLEKYSDSFELEPFKNENFPQEWFSEEGYFQCLPTVESMGIFAALFHKTK